MNLLSTLSNFTAGARSRSNTRFFESLDESLNSCPSEGYEAVDLVNAVLRKNEIFRDRLRVSPDLELSEIKSLIPWTCFDNKTTTRVIDFGGGGGYHYFIARAALDLSKKLDWNVVETPTLAQAARKLQNPELNFHSGERAWINQFKGHIDLVFASSSLQYSLRPMDSLRDLIGLGARYLYITRTPFSEGSNPLFAVQSSRLRDNGPGPLPDQFRDRKIEYPIIFEPRLAIESLIQEQYRVVLRINEGEWGGLGKNIRTWGYLCERYG